jgi:hypothetical protein
LEQRNRSFIIIAFSYGTLLGLDLTKLLETANIRGDLILIDASPDYLRGTCAEKMFYEGNVYDNVLEAFDINFELIDYQSLRSDVNRKAIFDKVQNVTNNPEAIDMKLQKFCADVIKRTKLIFEYDDSHLKAQIDSKITLIRSRFFDETDIDEAYGLNEYARNKVTVKYANGTHFTMLDTYIDDLIEKINECAR